LIIIQKQQNNIGADQLILIFMEKVNLTESISIKTIEEEATRGVFDIGGLYRGYGLTIGNALRRVLLSSLPGAAITQVKIKGVGHEFTTIKGVLEDVVELTLNLKRIRFSFAGDEPETLTLTAKGEGEVTAKNIANTGRVQVFNKDEHIATITEKNTNLEIELTVQKGLGYMSVNQLKSETLPVGVIQIDAIFSPVRKVNFTVENMRVGDRIDYNKVRFIIDTDGGISPKDALTESVRILAKHFDTALTSLVGGSAPAEEEALSEDAPEVEALPEEEEKPKAKKASKKK